MNEWEVVGVIITLLGLVSVFTGAAWKFSSMLSKLETLIQNLTVTVENIQEEQKLSKQKLEDAQKELSVQINSHEKRIYRLESEIEIFEKGVKNDTR